MLWFVFCRVSGFPFALRGGDDGAGGVPQGAGVPSCRDLFFGDPPCSTFTPWLQHLLSPACHAASHWVPGGVSGEGPLSPGSGGSPELATSGMTLLESIFRWGASSGTAVRDGLCPWPWSRTQHRELGTPRPQQLAHAQTSPCLVAPAQATLCHLIHATSHGLTRRIKARKRFPGREVWLPLSREEQAGAAGVSGAGAPISSGWGQILQDRPWGSPGLLTVWLQNVGQCCSVWLLRFYGRASER